MVRGAVHELCFFTLPNSCHKTQSSAAFWSGTAHQLGMEEESPFLVFTVFLM